MNNPESLSLIAERNVPGTGDLHSMEVQTRMENLVMELTRLMESEAMPSFNNSQTNLLMQNLIQRLNEPSGGFFNRSALPPVAESANPSSLG